MTEYISKDRVRELVSIATRKYPNRAANVLIHFLYLLNKEPAANVIPLHMKGEEYDG